MQDWVKNSLAFSATIGALAAFLSKEIVFAAGFFIGACMLVLLGGLLLQTYQHYKIAPLRNRYKPHEVRLLGFTVHQIGESKIAPMDRKHPFWNRSR